MHSSSRRLAAGFVEGPQLVCDGQPQPWTASVTPFGGRFRGGPATLTLSLIACETLCEQVQVSERVILRGGA